MPRAGSGMTINFEDGMIAWYNGPEWDAEALQEFETAENQFEAHMKANAPWEDRSGQARESLSARAYGADGIITMELSHGVPYGFWLEVIQNGRFAIIGPTIEAEGRRLVYNAIRRIRYARRGRSL